MNRLYSTRMKRLWVLLITVVLVGIIGLTYDQFTRHNKLPSIETFPPEGDYLIGLYGHSLELTADGGFVVAGYIKYHSRGKRDHDIWVMKVDDQGEKEWCRTYGGASTDRAWSIKQTRGRGFLITGESYSFGNNYQAIILQLDKNGDQEWYQLIGGDHTERGKDIAFAPNGNALITGAAYSDSLDRPNFLLCEVTPKGKVLDVMQFDHGLSGEATSLAVLNVGEIVLLGNLQQENTHSIDFGVLRIDPAGKISNKNAFGSIHSDEARSVVAHNDGGYLVAGTEYKDAINKSDCVVYKFNNLDELQWKSFFGGAALDGAEKIIRTQDGGSAIVGHTRSFGEGLRDIYIVKLDAAGNAEWSQTFGGSNTDWGYDIKQTPDNGFLISAGSKSTGQNATDIWIIKLNQAGAKAWDKVYCSADQ